MLEQLQADGQPTGVATVGKALGVRWKALTDEERQVGNPFALASSMAVAFEPW